LSAAKLANPNAKAHRNLLADRFSPAESRRMWGSGDISGEFRRRSTARPAAESINGACFTQETSSMVIGKDIEVYSMCEQHMLPFFGRRRDRS